MKGVGNLTDVVCWGEAPVEGATLLSDWLQRASPDFSARRREPSDLAAICYTSGTTGWPKGAMQSHRAVVGAAMGTALMAARTADDRVVTALPLFHVYGSSVFNAAMIAGSTLIVIPRFNEVAVLSAIQRYRATMMDGVPTAYSGDVTTSEGESIAGRTRCMRHLSSTSTERSLTSYTTPPGRRCSACLEC
jgi:long-chain acyl-CoA synthetase